MTFSFISNPIYGNLGTSLEQVLGGAMTTLPEQDLLIVFAEVSIAVAGFSGIAAVVGRPQDDSAKKKMKSLIVAAVLVVCLSLLPLTLALAGIQSDTIWRLASSVVVLWTVVYYFINRSDFAPANYDLAWAIAVLGDLVMVLALSAAVFGYPVVGYSFVYLAALLYQLVQALTWFVHSMAGLWSRPLD